MKIPDDDSRSVVLGSTGSGKTTCGAYLLAYSGWKHRPTFILNWKGDVLLNKFPAKPMSLTDRIPEEPGFYMIHLLPDDDDDLAAFFYRCWMHENVIIYVDEATNVPRYGAAGKWFRACLTQGRSKNIQMIICSQRPVDLDKYVFSEANYFFVYNLNWVEDRKKLLGYIDGSPINRLDRFYFRWYDVGEQATVIFRPVPTGPEIVKLIEPPAPEAIGTVERLERKRIAI